MSTQSTIYLDYASTTPVDPRVASKMMEFLTPEGEFGNPASRSHRFGWKAFHPNRCEREAGFPNSPSGVKNSIILDATLGSTGVVDA